MSDAVSVAAETLAIVGLPACVVDTAGRALAVNGLFEILRPRLVAVLGDRICIANKIANDLLHQSIGELNSRGAKAVSPIPVPAIEGFPALILHVASMRHSAQVVFQRASALMVATPLSKPSMPPVALVAALFGLTRSEARVAEGIIHGKSVGRVANDLGLSVATVRSYLKSVFGKTGVHRQAELVSLLACAQPLGL
jgi:DNA-binding CsgD family transcriptional regulator